MDDVEKKLLNKRRLLFEDHVQVTDQFLDILQDNELINSEILAEIKTEKVNVSRVQKLIENLLTVTTPDAFNKLCAVLVKDYSWVCRDLQLDVRLEKGQLQLDEDVLQQAATLVHKRFGTSKRLSEGDKKEMAELMALLLQVSKEDWKRELNQVREQLNQQCELNEVKNTKASTLNKKLQRFLWDNDAKLTTHAHDMTTTSDIVSQMKEENPNDAFDERLDGLRFYLDILYSKVKKVLSYQDFMLGEREKCLNALGVENEKTPLDEVVKEKLQTLPQQVTTAREEIEKQKAELFRINRLLSERNQENDQLQDQLKNQELKSLMYMEELQAVRQEREQLQADLAGLKENMVTASQGKNHKKK